MYDATGVRLHAGRQAEVKLFVAVNIFCCVHVSSTALIKITGESGKLYGAY